MLLVLCCNTTAGGCICATRLLKVRLDGDWVCGQAPIWILAG
jgi:hypothetical protein